MRKTAILTLLAGSMLMVFFITSAFGATTRVIENEKQKRYTSQKMPPTSLVQKNFEMMKNSGVYTKNIKVFGLSPDNENYALIIASGGKWDEYYYVRRTTDDFWVIRVGSSTLFWVIVDN